MAAERAERRFEAQRAQTKLNFGEEKEKKELLMAGPNEMLECEGRRRKCIPRETGREKKGKMDEGRRKLGAWRAQTKMNSAERNEFGEG